MNTETKLWNKNFILYVVAFELAAIGRSLLNFAIPVYILMTTDDPALFGVVMTLSWLPYVFFTMIGGGIADRFCKRKVIVFGNFLIALTISAYVILNGNLDTLMLSIVILIAAAAFESLQSASFETTVYDIIPMDQLMRANSVTWVLMIASGVFAPIIAGFMLTHLGLEVIVYASLVLHLKAAGLNAFMKIPYEKPVSETGIFRTVSRDFENAVKFVWQEEIFKKSTIAFFLYSLILFPILFAIPAVLINVSLGMGETRLGFANGIISAGGICGVVLLGRLGAQINIKTLPKLLIVSAIIQLITTGAFMLTSGNIAYGFIVLGGLLVNTVLVMVSLIYFTYLGQNTPEDIVGKIMAFAMTIMMIGGAISQFVLGRLFNIFSNNLAMAALVLPIVVLLLLPLTKIKRTTLNDPVMDKVSG